MFLYVCKNFSTSVLVPTYGVVFELQETINILQLVQKAFYEGSLTVFPSGLIPS